MSIWKLDLRSSGYATQAVAEKTDIYRIFLLHLKIHNVAKQKVPANIRMANQKA